MQPTFIYDINMWRHVGGGILCNEYWIRSDHEESHSHFIMSFTTKTDFFHSMT